MKVIVVVTPKRHFLVRNRVTCGMTRQDRQTRSQSGICDINQWGEVGHLVLGAEEVHKGYPKILLRIRTKICVFNTLLLFIF
jgi:hypothetical protein